MSSLGNLLGSAGRIPAADATQNESNQANATAENVNGGEQGSEEPNQASNTTTAGNFDWGVEESENTGDREPALIATSLPIQRLKIGRFQFERGVLHLFESKDVEDFRKIVRGLPARDRNQIKIIDKESAERLVRPIEPGATKQFDSSVGRQRERSATGEQMIGDKPLDESVGGQGEKFAKTAQMDNNAPVNGTAANQVVNPLNEGDVDQKAKTDSQS